MPNQERTPCVGQAPTPKAAAANAKKQVNLTD